MAAREVLSELGWKPLAGFLAYLILAPLVFFLAAGTAEHPYAWAYFGLHVSFGLGSRILILRMSPGLILERARSLERSGTSGWDRVLSPIVGIIGPMLIWIVAGLDNRFGFSAEIAPLAKTAGLAVVAGGYALGSWAMAANPFFSATVRIQSDRGHTVISSGPYRLVRHPAYAGAVAALLAMPIVLGSWLALVPALVTDAVVLLRTHWEDRTLYNGLAGYAEYSRRIRFRILPGVW